MGWTAGKLEARFTAHAALEFEFGAGICERVLDTCRRGAVIYAAVRASESREVFGRVLLTEREGGRLYTKPISEDMGPAQADCPTRILTLLTEPSNENARAWRARCAAQARARDRTSRAQK